MRSGYPFTIYQGIWKNFEKIGKKKPENYNFPYIFWVFIFVKVHPEIPDYPIGYRVLKIIPVPVPDRVRVWILVPDTRSGIRVFGYTRKTGNPIPGLPARSTRIYITIRYLIPYTVHGLVPVPVHDNGRIKKGSNQGLLIKCNGSIILQSCVFCI